MMRIFSFRKRGTGRSRAAVVYATATATVMVLAVTARGEPSRQIELDNGGVWVTSDADRAFGRFNKQINQLDAVLFPAQADSADLDVLQDGDAVVAWDRGAGTLTAVDPAQRTPAGDAVDAPPGSQAALAGGSLAVLGPTGDLRATRTGTAPPDVSPVATTAPALVRVEGSKPALAVGTDGAVHVVGGASLLSLRPADARFAPVRRTAVPGGSWSQVTAVGDTPVLLDTESGTVLVPRTRKSVRLPGDADGAVLQLPGPSASTVLVAGAGALWAVGLDDGAVTQVSGGGTGRAAAPVRTGACVHAAWGGGRSAYVKQCGSAVATPPQPFAAAAAAVPVFRVNRGHVVLNDTAGGAVYTVDASVKEQKGLWDRITPRPVNQPPDPNLVREQLPHDGEDRPPAPVDDSYGARPGRATVLHVLDNDTDPEGDLLVVSAVSAPDVPGATAAIAPDGQSIVVTLPEGSTRSLRLRYTADDGYGKSATATAVVEPRADDDNAKPAPRSGYVAPKLSVAPGGSLRLPVLSDWRDFDGDPMVVAPRDDSGSTAVTSDGLLLFTAPPAPGRVDLRYTVSDGLSGPVGAKLTVTVLDPDGTPTSVAPLARPDAIRVPVGQPVPVHPLANDLPGADAVDPTARMTIARDVRPAAGLVVTTDTERGVVSVRASRPGAYQLEYAAAFGSAPMATGVLRVDAVAAPSGPSVPVAMPDSAVVRGSRPVVVDVLANDVDPGGGLLVVQHAEGDDVSGLSVSVVDGRLLRISGEATNTGNGRVASGSVAYLVTNGVSAPVTGSVSVTRLPDDGENNAPFAVDDTVSVRSGDSTAVPVLENDFDPDGDPLRLANAPIDSGSSGTAAAVAGRSVRIAAPAGVTEPRQVALEYVVEDTAGARGTGRVLVSIVPAGSPDDDQPPTPKDLEGRLVAGDTYVVKIPVYGVDPDGDSVTTTGIVRAPRLGRVVESGADFVTYQAYPTSAGTDSFTYEVQDPYGQSAQATVQLGVMPPGAHSGPVAVDDDVEARPGRTVRLDVTQNDVVPSGATARVLPLDHDGGAPPKGVRLDGNVLTVPVPDAGAQPTAVAYSITDGSGVPTTAHVSVRGVQDATIAPVARDDVATGTPGADGTIAVDVLANDGDPDGPSGDLVVEAFGAVRAEGGRVFVRPGEHPRQVAYRVTDGDGRTAVAAVRVGGRSDDRPRLTPGARIRVDAGGSAVVKLADVVTSPSGRAVRLTTVDHLGASPTEGLAASARDAATVTVRATGRYAGPGAVSFQVTDGDTLQDERGRLATVTVPVQVGPDAPALRCPAAPVEVVAGGADVRSDVMRVCHVWVDTTLPDPPEISIGTRWATAASGVEQSVVDRTTLVLTANSSAKPGTKGSLTLSVPGTGATSTLPVVVVAARPPKARPVVLPALRAGVATTVDVADYVTSPLREPSLALEGVTQRAGRKAPTTVAGTRLTVTPDRDASGPVSFDVVVTDLPGRGDRQVRVPVTGTVQGRPGRPPKPTVVSEGNETVVITWRPPADNGAPIRHYEIGGAGRGVRCLAAPCTLRSLENGTRYQITVTAVNVVGKSDVSAPVAARPDQVPPEIARLTTVESDRSLAVSWTAPRFGGSPIRSYQVQIQPAPASGAALRSVTTTSTRFTSLTNGVTYRIRVRAKNDAEANDGYGAWNVPAAGVPFGKPAAMPAPAARGADVPDPAANRAITVSWGAADGNGRDVTKYTVVQYVDSSAGGGFGTRAGQVSGAPGSFAAPGGFAKSFTVPNDGRFYRFTVQATNSEGLSSPVSPKSDAVQAAAPPNRITNLTAKDHPDGTNVGYNGAIHVFFTIPAANAAQLTKVEYEVNGSRGEWASPGAPGTSVEKAIAVTNGTPSTVSVRGCNEAGLCGPWSERSNQVTPYGPPAAPNVTADMGGTSVSYGWNGGGGNGRPVQYYRVCIDGGCSNTGAGSTTRNYDYSQGWSITVHVVDTAGQVSGTVTRNGTMPPEPPSLVVSKGASVNSATCTSSSCAWVHVTARKFAPNTRYTITYHCSNGSPCNPWWTATFTTDGSGGASFTNQAYYGFPGAQVWVRAGGVESNHLTWQ